MTIKKKLICNALLTLAGIAVIGGVSLLGMKFVQGKLFILTERSTPFQLKTIEMQRTLQEHTSNLLEVAFSGSSAELVKARGNAEHTLAELDRVGKELNALKAKDGAERGKGEHLDKMTREMFATTEARIKAEEAAHAADAEMRVKLQEITRKLSEMDDSVQKKQKTSSRQLSASSGSASEITQKLMSLTTARDFVKDANYAVSELVKATGKKGVIIARGKLDSALNEFAKNRLVVAGDPSVKASADLLAEVRKLVTGPQGLLELKGAMLSKPAAEAPSQEYDQVAQSVGNKISSAFIEIEQSVTLATAKYNQESHSHDVSLKGSNAAGDVLAQNGTLISLGLDIKSGIREMFEARSTEELTRLTNEVRGRFASAEAVQHRMAGSLSASGSTRELAELRNVGGLLSRLKGQLLSKDGVADKLQQVLRVRTQAAALNKSLKELVAEQNEQGRRGVTAAQSEQEKAVGTVNRMVRSFVLVVSILGLAMIVFGLATSLMLARSITNPVNELTDLAERFGNGDFSVTLDASRKDEFGVLAKNFNHATEKLGEITVALTGAIGKLADHSRHLYRTAEELSQGASEQALATKESASAMTQMSQSINEVAGSASHAADASQHALQTATKGCEVVTGTAQGMEKIASSVRDAAALVHNLGERSEEVGSIIGIINDIADQTTLLALNASIEAARAGEMGMGFAVVADEVRKLATRTTEATSEISAMVKDIQEGTSRTVKAMKAGDESVAGGVELAREASRSLEEILAVSNQSAEMAERIAAASEEQSTAAEEISANMDCMADITRRTEESTKEIRHYSEELQQIADDLSRMAAWFQHRAA